jgi:tripartite-type tricarboxylate transporter receptor subunit TctC
MLRSTFAREIAAAAAFAGFLCVAPAPAQEVSFAGKKIDMYIGSSPGGGTDLSSRLIGDFVVKYLPGKPAIVYRNIPGGQGVKALNYFARDVKPDGLGFAGGSQGHFDPAGGRQSAIEYDPLTFKYIGGINRGGTVFVFRREAIERLSKPGAKPVVVPAVAGASTGPQMALWGKEYLGWNVKFVIGYSGTPAMILAAMNGEADSMASSSSSQLKPLLDNPAFAPFTQLGDLNDSGKFVPRVAFPNVKVFADIIAPKLAKNDGEILLAWLQTQ